jgi:hypothetical protein
VGEVRYFGTDAVETCNLASLVGLHSAFLNGLLRRAAAAAAGHAEAGFPGGDLIQFLREDWAGAVVGVGFADAAGALREALAGGGAEGAATLPALDDLWAALEGLLREGGGDAECAEAVERAVGVGGAGMGPEAKQRVMGVVARLALQPGWA